MNPFREYDVRGVVGEELLYGDVESIGLVHSNFLNQESVIGFDQRLSSSGLFNNFCSGYTDGGNDLINIGLVPISVCNFYGFKNNLHNVYITGSHTPKNYNGIKFFNNRGVIYNGELRVLEKRFLKKSFYPSLDKGVVKSVDSAVNDYINYILERVNVEKSMRIILDCGNGTAGIVAPRLLESLGCEVIVLNEEPDGSFPNRSPEPCDESLGLLKKKVVSENADFGVGFDGDADRSVFVDDKGRVVDSSLIISFFAKHLLKKRKGDLAVTVDCSSIIKNVSNNIVWCSVGMKNIDKVLENNNIVFAGEVSDHYYFPDFFPFSDGILSTVRMAEILSSYDKSFNELLKNFFTYPIKHGKIVFDNHEDKFRVFEKVKNHILNNYSDASCVDGVKFFINSSDWVLIRPSNTEPVIRLSVESKNVLNETYDKFFSLVSNFYK